MEVDDAGGWDRGLMEVEDKGAAEAARAGSATPHACRIACRSASANSLQNEQPIIQVPGSACRPLTTWANHGPVNFSGTPSSRTDRIAPLLQSLRALRAKPLREMSTRVAGRKRRSAAPNRRQPAVRLQECRFDRRFSAPE